MTKTSTNKQLSLNLNSPSNLPMIGTEHFELYAKTFIVHFIIAERLLRRFNVDCPMIWTEPVFHYEIYCKFTHGTFVLLILIILNIDSCDEYPPSYSGTTNTDWLNFFSAIDVTFRFPERYCRHNLAEFPTLLHLRHILLWAWHSLKPRWCQDLPQKPHLPVCVVGLVCCCCCWLTLLPRCCLVATISVVGVLSLH